MSPVLTVMDLRALNLSWRLTWRSASPTAPASS